MKNNKLWRVKSVSTKRLDENNSLYKQAIQVAPEWVKEIWLVYIETELSLTEKQVFSLTAFSETYANQLAKQFAVGTMFDPKSVKIISGFDEIDDTTEEALKQGRLAIPLPGLNALKLECAKVFIESGFHLFGKLPDDKIADLNVDQINEIKEKFPETWDILIAFHYAFNSLDHASPEYLACAYFYYTTINKPVEAGYTLCKFAYAYTGVVNIAEGSIKTRANAGKSGGEKSKNSRIERRSHLFSKIESIMIENPAFSKIALKSIVEVAVQECIIENPRLWTQGAAQAQEYIGEIRRGDAGEELKNRYNNLFPNTGKKRRG